MSGVEVLVNMEGVRINKATYSGNSAYVNLKDKNMAEGSLVQLIPLIGVDKHEANNLLEHEQVILQPHEVLTREVKNKQYSKIAYLPVMYSTEYIMIIPLD